jgi:ribonuclease T2
MIMGRSVCCALVIWLFMPFPLLAQSGRGAPGSFDFYVLALSWMPGFCEAEGFAKRRSQCVIGRRTGFVLHGLWPQNERGYPAFCGIFPQNPLQTDIKEAADIFPDSALARHQWRKHGTCSGLSPPRYFAASRQAKAAVVIPASFETLQQNGSASVRDIERVFTQANPGLRADQIQLACRGDRLYEIRFCLDRNLKGFRSCPELQRRECRAEPVRITASPRQIPVQPSP